MDYNGRTITTVNSSRKDLAKSPIINGRYRFCDRYRFRVLNFPPDSPCPSCLSSSYAYFNALCHSTRVIFGLSNTPLKVRSRKNRITCTVIPGLVIQAATTALPFLFYPSIPHWAMRTSSLSGQEYTINEVMSCDNPKGKFTKCWAMRMKLEVFQFHQLKFWAPK